MADLEIKVQDTIKTKEHVGSRVNRLEVFVDTLIKFLEAVKEELQKQNGQ